MYPIQSTFCQDLVSRKALIFYKLTQYAIEYPDRKYTILPRLEDSNFWKSRDKYFLFQLQLKVKQTNKQNNNNNKKPVLSSVPSTSKKTILNFACVCMCACGACIWVQVPEEARELGPCWNWGFRLFCTIWHGYGNQMSLLQEQCCCEYIPYNAHNLSMMLTQRTGWPSPLPLHLPSTPVYLET